MSQRSSQNARTQKQMTGDAKGMTRKGAGSARPSRDAATTVRTVAPGKARAKTGSGKSSAGGGLFGGNSHKKEERRLERERRDREALVANIEVKKHPRYATYRRVWWVLLGLGLFMTIVCWIVMAANPETSRDPYSTMGMASTGSLIAAYACILAGFIFDWIKIRPMRRNAEKTAAQMSDKKLNAVIEEDYEQREAAKAAKTAKDSRQTKAANKQQPAGEKLESE